MQSSFVRKSVLLAFTSAVATGALAAQFTDQADVTSVRGVFDTATEQRCWVDREQIVDRGSEANVPGAIIGGIVGGVLGHQVGGGRGRDVATAGGAVAGAMLGANVGRDDRGDRYTERQVEHCRDVPSTQPSHWDVEYVYGGKVFHTQLNYQPGPQIPVRVSVEPQ